MIKKLTFILLAAGCTQIMYAQSTEKNEKFLENKTLFEELTNVKKKQDKFNLFLNMQGSFDANFRDGFEEGAFKMRQLRIEAKGNINNWLSYRYRQRLNRSNDSSGNIDNLPTSIDIAGIGVKLGKGFSIFAGKQCTAYGGIEFDLNPIEIYEYSDMIENMSNFMTGLNIGYDINAHQQLNLQILDSRNGSFNKTYGVETNCSSAHPTKSMTITAWAHTARNSPIPTTRSSAPAATTRSRTTPAAGPRWPWDRSSAASTTTSRSAIFSRPTSVTTAPRVSSGRTGGVRSRRSPPPGASPKSRSWPQPGKRSRSSRSGPPTARSATRTSTPTTPRRSC